MMGPLEDLKGKQRASLGGHLINNRLSEFHYDIRSYPGINSPGSAQDIYWREVTFGIPGKRWGGRLVEMAHQEDPNCADKKHRRYDKKADPVDDTANQEPLFILLR